MSGRFWSGITIGISCLLCWTFASAQHADTIRVGQEADTSTVVAPPDTAQTVETLQTSLDTSVVTSKDAPADHTEPVVMRSVADSTIANWKDDKGYAYANDPDYWQWRDDESKNQNGKKSGQLSSDEKPGLLVSRGFEYFILILMAGILVFAVVRIILANRIQLFYRAPMRPTAVNSEEPGSLEDDLDGQLIHFMQTKNYRQAVRYLYLKTLRLLNDQGLIRYQQEATNEEYWQQLRTTPQGPSFRNLTSIYEKVWYGEFPLEDTLFSRLHHYFEEFYKSVRA